LSVEEEEKILDARERTNWGEMRLQFLCGRHRSTIGRTVGADDTDDFAVLRDQLPVERRRRVEMRRGPLAAAARRRRIVALSVAPKTCHVPGLLQINSQAGPRTPQRRRLVISSPRRELPGRPTHKALNLGAPVLVGAIPVLYGGLPSPRCPAVPLSLEPQLEPAIDRLIA
jgi:hypothetical protein